MAAASRAARAWKKRSGVRYWAEEQPSKTARSTWAPRYIEVEVSCCSFALTFSSPELRAAQAAIRTATGPRQ